MAHRSYGRLRRTRSRGRWRRTPLPSNLPALPLARRAEDRGAARIMSELWPNDTLRKDVHDLINRFQPEVQNRCDAEGIPIVALVSVTIMRMGDDGRIVKELAAWTL